MGKHPVALVGLLVPPGLPARRRVTRQSSVGVAVAVNSRSEAARGPGGHLSGAAMLVIGWLRWAGSN